MKTLKHYLKNREDGIHVLLGNHRRNSTPASIHQFRIEIKKLDSLLHVINFCSKNFRRKKTFAPFKLIFHQAGVIRELQLEASYLKKYLTRLPNYRNILKKRTYDQKEKFYSIIDKIDSSRFKKIYSGITDQLTTVTIKKIKKYIEQQQSLTYKLLNHGALQIRKSHEFRKLLKLIQYSSNLLKKKKENKPKNGALPALLGKWHERDVLISRLRQVIRNETIPIREIRALKKIISTLISENRLFFKRIQGEIHHELNLSD